MPSKQHNLRTGSDTPEFNFRNYTINSNEEKQVSTNNDNLDDILASGDDAAIEAALENMEGVDDLLFEDSDDEIEVANVDSDTTKNDVAQAQAEATPEPSPAEVETNQQGVIEKDGKFFVEVSKDNAEIESKNGKHKLPYDLLAGTREENLELKRQLEEQSQSNAALESTLNESKRVADLYSKQLGEAGLDPKLLPEQMLKDPELMAQVKEDYPQIGELVEALANQLQQPTAPKPDVAQQSETPSNVSENSVEQALEQTTDLKEWMNNDPDRWDMAKLIDGQLAKDPSFENKTTTERFIEVERRVNGAFGDVSKAAPKAAEKPPAQQEKTLIPNSPTDLGTQTSDISSSTQFMEKGAAEMSSQMENMSDAQIEAMLAEASDFL